MRRAQQRPPHPKLLRARLLFDGNYCTRARAQLEAIDQETLTEQEHLEYLYRTGRVLDGLADYEGATSFYLRTVQLGRKNPAFYACKSALQAGLIEEKHGGTVKPGIISTLASTSPLPNIKRDFTCWPKRGLIE